jgi:hypothetical protein
VTRLTFATEWFYGAWPDDAATRRARSRRAEHLMELQGSVWTELNPKDLARPCRAVVKEAPLPQWLPMEKMATELLIFAQPKLGLRNRRSRRAVERLLLNHPGALG